MRTGFHCGVFRSDMRPRPDHLTPTETIKGDTMIKHLLDAAAMAVAIVRQSASNPALQCFFALARSWTMKFIVASATEFIWFGNSSLSLFATRECCRRKASHSP